MDTLSRCEISESNQDELVKIYAQMVKRIAHHLWARLPQSVLVDDLIQVGMLGLLEAIKHYDDSKGACFETYASIRIRGYMLDEIRANDWVPRSVYRNARIIAKAVNAVENRLGREAKDAEIAAELNLSLGEYYTLVKDAASSQLQAFEDLSGEDEFFTKTTAPKEPHNQVMQSDLIQQLAGLIDGLPEKERLVLSLYYERDLNLKEIGEVLTISESRVSQILSQATIRLKARFSLSLEL